MIRVLSERDMEALALSDAAIRAAVEAGLQAQAEGRALAEPTTIFKPTPGRDDLIAVIKGALRDEKLALVKTVGGFPGNDAMGLATNPGCLILMETETGQIVSLLPAAAITTQRTAMVTAIGAFHLARPDARVLASIGTRGVAAQAVRYIAGAFPLDEIRIHGRDAEAAARAAEALSRDLGVPVRTTSDWSSCLEGADIMIDGSALPGDAPLFPMEAVRPGTLVIAFGAYSAFPSDAADSFDRLVMDRWSADGRGALGPQTKAGRVTEDGLDALIGDVVSGRGRARTSGADRVLFVHRGVAACDLTLAQTYLAEAGARGIGAEIPF
ncbi:MAG: hypothetical protein AAF367_20595 [Pseudomonadota bacterium]